MLFPDSSDCVRGSGDGPGEDLSDFLELLNELRTSGCNILVCGDVPREVFTRTSDKMLGADEELRYRVLAVTDATAQSVAERLPDPDVAPRSITETSHVLNHAGAVRSITSATSARTPTKLAGVRETRIADPELAGLQSELLDAIDDFALRGNAIHPADIRVGIDSLEPLLDFYGEEMVRNCLGTVGRYVRKHGAMAHYVLPKPYDSDVVQALTDEMDVIVELQLADSDDDADAKQRWHAPDRELETNWIPL